LTSRVEAIAKSSQHLAQALSRTGPSNNGAPRSEASRISTRPNDFSS